MGIQSLLRRYVLEKGFLGSFFFFCSACKNKLCRRACNSEAGLNISCSVYPGTAEFPCNYWQNLRIYRAFVCQAPFLSVGDDIGERHVRHRGHGSMAGSFVVEDYLGDGDVWFRQLVFGSRSTLVQTQVKLQSKQRKFVMK